MHVKFTTGPSHGNDISYYAREGNSRSRAREERILMVPCVGRKDNVTHGPKDANCEVQVWNVAPSFPEGEVWTSL